MKPMPRRTWIAAAALAATFSSGCIVVDDDDGYLPVPPPHEDAFYTTIDAGEQFTKEVVLGEGAAVFVEYRSGGIWNVWTSCDTADSGISCLWEVYITSHEPIRNWQEVALDGYDFVDPSGADGLDFIVETAYGYDELEFETTPRALVQMEVVLDGFDDPGRFIWFGNGTVHDFEHGNTAPRSPVVFQPDSE